MFDDTSCASMHILMPYYRCCVCCTSILHRSMTEPIRVTNPYIDNFVEGRAIGVDVEAKKVQVQLSALSTVTGAFKGIACNA